MSLKCRVMYGLVCLLAGIIPRGIQSADCNKGLHTLSSGVGTDRQLPKSTIIPGFPITVKTDDPGVQQAARFGVYRYNNRSNDIFLFRESCISKATLQVVRGLKYTVNVDIGRTVCTKRTHPDLDRCAFQRNKTLRQTFSCYFEVWITPWLHRVQILASSCQ